MKWDSCLELLAFVRRNSPKRSSLLLPLLAVAVLAYWAAPAESVKAVLVAFAFLLGVVYEHAGRPKHRLDEGPFAKPKTSLLLARHPELMTTHDSLTQSLIQLANQSDEILKEATMLKLAAVQDELQTLASGKIVFSDTEAWHATYERILRTPGLKRYLSVAWLRNEDYWRDTPGRHSMQLNYDLVQLGVPVERTLILNDFFWPPAAVLPAKVICEWIREQDKRGITMRLVRESELEEERDLLCDFGLYGDRACGLLELDEQCQTLRFTLDFTRQSLRKFEDRWRRLLLFAVSFRSLLDRKTPGG